MLESPLDHTAVASAPTRSSRLARVGRGIDRSIGLLSVLAFASQVIVAAMQPVLPLFAVQLGASPVLLGLLVSISTVASGVGQFTGGFVADRAGARRLLPAGMVAYGVGTLLTGTVSSADPLLAIRGVAGLGTGTYILGERLYIRQAVDRGRLAFANGLVQSADAIGLIVGPVLGGVAAAVTGLREAFFIFGVAGLLVAAGAWLLPARTRPDAAAAAPEDAYGQANRTGLTVLLLSNLAFAAGYGSFITTFAPFTNEVLGWSTAEIGIAFSVFGLGVVAVGPWLGGAADRIGRRRVGALATIPIVAFAVALVVPTPTVLLYLLAFAAGSGVSGFTASWFALLSIAAGGSRGAPAFGVVAGVSSFGAVVGAIGAGELWESIDIRAGMLLTVIAMGLAGFILNLYRDAASTPVQVEEAASG